MTACPENAPLWVQNGWKDIGIHEQPENRGPYIARLIAESHCGEQGYPWCAMFANAKLETAGIKGTRSPSSQSFRHSADFVPLSGPALGAIVVYWRTPKQSGLGHVGFYIGEKPGYIYTLGGNEGDMVQVEFCAKAAGSFGLEGYYWPKSVPLPKIAPIAVAANVPSHLVSVT